MENFYKFTSFLNNAKQKVVGLLRAMKILPFIYIILFFIGWLCIGLYILPDYGLSWDEPLQRTNGRIALNYVYDTLGIEEPNNSEWEKYTSYQFRYNGVLFTMAANLIEQYLELEDYRSQHLLRHYMVFGLFWLAGIAFFLILRMRFGGIWLPLLGLSILIFHPRIFAHAFYNVKDIVLLSATIFVVYTLLLYLKKPVFYTALLHGLLCGIAISLRIVAVILPVLSVAVMLLSYNHIKRQKYGYTFLNVSVFTVSTIVFTILFWPLLWADPIGQFMKVFTEASNYSWDGELLYWGQLVKSTGLPWQLYSFLDNDYYAHSVLAGCLSQALHFAYMALYLHLMQEI